jgi:polyhydroxyalkanoate synthesis regulator phasin
LASRKGSVAGEVRRLKAGLARLADAQSAIDELSQAAAVQRSAVKEKQAAADAAMTAITEALSGAAERRREVEVLRAKVRALQARNEAQVRRANDAWGQIRAIVRYALRPVEA